MTPKIGEIITITKRKGSTWHSGAGGGDPRNVELPFTGKVTNIKYDALCVGGYGFSLTHITWGIHTSRTNNIYMNIPIFKPGDTVECIKDMGGKCKVGKVYIITKGNYIYASLTNPNDICVNVGIDGKVPYYARGFKLIEPAEPIIFI